MFITMSKLKRVCAMILVPRFFRGPGCTPGKFYRLKFDVVRKARKSTDSDPTDHTKREEFRCRKCKKIIEYAFGPAEPYYAVDTNTGTHKDLAHVNVCAKSQEPEQQRLTNEKDEKIIAEWLKLNVQTNQIDDKNSATLLEDLKSKSLSQAKTNVLLRVRDLDTILAAVEKNEKELHTKTAEGKEGNVVLQATAGEGKEGIKPHDAIAETKERLIEQTASATEGKALKLQATAANKKNEEENVLAPKIEVIDEVPLVEAAPRTDIYKPSKDFAPSILNATRFEKPGLQEIQAQMFDKLAQKYIQSPAKEIDGQLVKEISRLNFPHEEETNLKQEVAKCESLNAKVKAVIKPELNNEVIDNSEHISLELQPEPIKPAESDIKIGHSSKGERITQVNISDEKEILPNDTLHCEFLGPAYEWRVALRDIGERPVQWAHSVDETQQEFSQCEHKQPCHLFRKNLVDVIHTTEPRIGLLIREYPVPKKVCFEAPQHMTDPADKRTIAHDAEDWKYHDSSAAYHYAETTKHSAVDKETHIVQPAYNAVSPDKQESIISYKDSTKVEAQTVAESNVNSKELFKEKGQREPTRAAVEMAHSFIQAQPCTELKHTKDHRRKEFPSDSIHVDDSLPEINLNDTTVSLTELLRRVRERNRILYCREVGLQMARNMAALNPEGKCGDKKPPCPPPQPRCPPPPPPCPPPPPPKCPPPCPPPKSDCPPPKCPPPCPPPPKCSPCPPPKDPCAKKNPCAKFRAQETITLVLHLGPLVNPGRKLILPVLATNFIPPNSSSEERPARGFLVNLISQKLLLLREILRTIFEGRPKELVADLILLKMNRSRDFTPWSPIPSWPYPIINKKRPLQCPQEGCPVDPPVNPAPKFQKPCPDKPCLDFPKLQNEESPVLARGFCKTDWTKPKYVTKPYTDVRSQEATETPKLPIEDLGVLEKSHSLKFIVLRKLLKHSDSFKFEVVKKKYQQILVYMFGWPQPLKTTEKFADENKEIVKLHATTAKQNEEERLTQKVEEISEVPLVEAEPKADILNPPQTLGPSVMTFNRSNTNTKAESIDDLAKKYLRIMSSKKKIDEQFLSAQMEKIGLWSDSRSELMKAEGTVHNIVKHNSLDDTEDTVQSKISDDTSRLDTEENTTAVKKAELKTKNSHTKGDTMLIDITLFGSSCPRSGQSILKEAYEISRNSILTTKESVTKSNCNTEPTSQAKQLYTIYDELPETKPNEKKMSLTELLRRVRERNQTLHRREMELQMASKPELDTVARRPGCQPPSPHIGQQPRVSRSPPLIQRPCPSKPREPIKPEPEAPAKKDPCAKCSTTVKNPSTLALLAPIVFPPFLPLLMCSISPIVSYSVSKLSCAKVLTDGIKERLFGYTKLEKNREEILERIDVVKEAKNMSQ